jgi:hypothetical protein
VDLTSGGWTPARVVWDGSGPEIEWCYTAGEPFTDPFFEQTLGRCVRRPFSLLFRPRTPIAMLAELQPGLQPSGFIFHASRCGSTAVAQVLAASARNLVLSEPSPVDAVLRLPASEIDRIEWLRRGSSFIATRSRSSFRNSSTVVRTWLRVGYPRSSSDWKRTQSE